MRGGEGEELLEEEEEVDEGVGREGVREIAGEGGGGGGRRELEREWLKREREGRIPD